MTNGSIDRRAYFERIGYRGAEEATLPVLQEIVFSHATSIPFENLDPLLGVTVGLEPAALEEKLIRGGRGGYCFEHNLIVLDVLTSLGFTVKPLSARVMYGRAPSEPVTPRSHMLLEVELVQGTYIVDVGFGRLTLTSAVRLVPEIVQETRHDRVRLVQLDDGFVLEAEAEDGFRPLYRFDRARQYRSDYELVSWYLCNSPASHFKHGLMAARATPNGRLTLHGNTFVSRQRGADAKKQQIADPAELRNLLSGPFGIRLGSSGDLDRVLAKVAAG